ncbi:MAG: YihY/virulence factor BrkB family protein [Nitrospiria bacterium]
MAARASHPPRHAEGRAAQPRLAAWGRALRRSIPAFLEDRGPTLAAALSYYVVISIFPLVLLVLSLSGLVLQDGSAQGAIIRMVTEYLPGSEILIAQTINTVILARGSLGGLAALGLLWTILGMFSVIEEAINTAWGSAARRTFLRSKLVSLAMFGTVSVLLLLSIAAAGSQIAARAAAAVPSGTWFQVSASIVASTTGFALLYRFVPRARVRWADVWPASVLTAGLWEAGKWGFLGYLSIADYASVYGQVGTVIALLVWGYISGAVLIWGAELCAEFADACGGER